MEDIKFEVIKKIGDTNFKVKNISNVSKLDSTSPPSVFIGSKLRYPLVNVGILSPLEKMKMHGFMMMKDIGLIIIFKLMMLLKFVRAY